jgi:phosphatidylinositol alpha-1,6-mannosyltransferase
MRAPALAAITLDASGGGVAVVAELLWRVLQHEFEGRAQLIPLLPPARQMPSLADKVRFGTRVVQTQIAGKADWMLFSHLALAKAQTRMPARLRVPYGVFLHGIEAWCPLSEGELQILRDADVRLSNSEYTARRVMAAHGGIGEVIPCPLALPPRHSGTDPALPFDPGPHAVLIVGRMSQSERYKGHDQLIEAWPFVTRLVPDATLVIAGGGDDLNRLREKASSAGVGDRVVFTGFVASSTLTALYRRAALFALPSRGEGFGLVYLEAMRAGLPCIGSTLDAAGEVIRDGETGVLVDQGNVPELADKVARLLRDEALRRRMGAAGREREAGVFSFARFHRRLMTTLTGAAQEVAL